MALYAALVLASCANTAEIVPARAQVSAENQAGLYLGVIDGLIKQGRHAAALAFLDSYAESDEELSPRYWLLRGDALLGLKRNSDAYVAFAKLDGTALAAAGANGRGRVAADSHDWQAAEMNFRKAVDGDPSNADFLNNLAFVEMRLGKPGDSAVQLEQAHELDPGSALIRNNLIIALTLKGETDRAGLLLANIKDDADREKIQALVKAALETLATDRKS